MNTSVVDQRKKRLEEKIGAALQQQKLNATPTKKINNSNEARLLLKNVQAQLASIPKPSKLEFERMPKEQQEQYISLVERLASQCALAIQFLEAQDKESLLNKQGMLNKTTHYTIEAIANVQQRQAQEMKQKLESIRKQVIDNQSKEDSTKRVSVHRLLHNIKKQKVTLQHISTVMEFVKHSLILNLPYQRTAETKGGTRQNPKPIASKKSPPTPAGAEITTSAAVVDANAEKQQPEPTSIYKQIAQNQNAQRECTVLFFDLKSWNIPNYALEECIMYSVAGNIHLTKSIEDPRCKALREKLKAETAVVEQFNAQLKMKWSALTGVEKLRYFVKDSFKEQFESIISQAHKLDLSEKNLIQLLLSKNLISADNDKAPEAVAEQKESFYDHSFTGDLSIPFQRAVSPELKDGVHVVSLKVSQKLNIPETGLVDNLSEEQIRKSLENGDIALKILGLDYLSKFKRYWKEIKASTNMPSSSGSAGISQGSPQQANTPKQVAKSRL